MRDGLPAYVMAKPFDIPRGRASIHTDRSVCGVHEARLGTMAQEIRGDDTGWRPLVPAGEPLTQTGYHATSDGEIGAAAGVSQVAVRDHWGGKQAGVVALFDEGLEALQTSADATDVPGETGDGVRLPPDGLAMEGSW